MKQTQNQVVKIPPLTKSEIIDFYTSGKMPARFEKAEKQKRDEILEKHGVKVDRVSTGG